MIQTISWCPQTNICVEQDGQNELQLILHSLDMMRVSKVCFLKFLHLFVVWTFDFCEIECAFIKQKDREDKKKRKKKKKKKKKKHLNPNLLPQFLALRNLLKIPHLLPQTQLQEDANDAQLLNLKLPNQNLPNLKLPNLKLPNLRNGGCCLLWRFFLNQNRKKINFFEFKLKLSPLCVQNDS